jgi:hypothetical protein
MFMQRQLPTARLVLINFIAVAILQMLAFRAAAQTGAVVSGERLDAAMEHLAAAMPSGLDDLTETRSKEILDASNALSVCAEPEAAALATPGARLACIHRLCVAKRRVDEELTRVLELRVAIGASADGEEHRRRARQFLGITSMLMDLSGRLNYLLRSTVVEAAFAFASEPKTRNQLVQQLASDRSTIGASLMAPLLIDPPPTSPNNAKPADTATKRKILRFLSKDGRYEAAPIVAQFLQNEEAAPPLVVEAADALCRLGLAQPPRPVDASRGSLRAVMTPRGLHTALRALDAVQLKRASRRRRAVLLDWLDQRARRGVGASGCAVNGFVIRPGDWVLMRNVSPYNLFTDLSPGLFTHAGVAALSRDPQGVGRLVLVDLNERDTHIGATNIEDVLPSALYFAVLRHDNPAVARTMGETAASIIGNPAQFDLAFETSRIAALRGRSLAGRKIETYCAGLLLLCAQASGLPRETFFPVVEYPGSDQLSQNLEQLGLHIGADFVSPTGALFGGRMKLVYLSEPMYDPARHIAQSIYDHFARRMRSETLVPRHNLFQSLRQELADASTRNALLGNALAGAAGVDPDTDLASAARALAVVETLDAIAAENSDEFADTLAALQAGPSKELARRGLSQSRIESIQRLRRRHADLVDGLERNHIDLRQVTDQLIRYYTSRGEQQINDRFFPAAAAQSADAGH